MGENSGRISRNTPNSSRAYPSGVLPDEWRGIGRFSLHGRAPVRPGRRGGKAQTGEEGDDRESHRAAALAAAAGKTPMVFM